MTEEDEDKGLTILQNEFFFERSRMSNFTMAPCFEMCHVDHGNGVALGHEWHQNKVWLWSFIFAFHGCLSVWSSLRCIDGEETAASKLKDMQLAHQIILKTLTH